MMRMLILFEPDGLPLGTVLENQTKKLHWLFCDTLNRMWIGKRLFIYFE